jgi:hypothetical protein
MGKETFLRTLHKGFAPALVALAFLLAARGASAQEQKPARAATQQSQARQAQPTTPAQTAATTQATTQTGATTQATSAASRPAAAAKAAPEPLYREFKGVRLGMSADEVRRKLGKPQEKSDEMDFFVFSDRQRARVYYDQDKKAHAIITTYVGKNAEAPEPSAVLGADVEAKADGSAYKLVQYPQAGYWVAYSRTGGDSPLVIITMQKTP